MTASDPRTQIVAIVFSKDRPLQLDATLRSLQRHCKDVASMRTQVLFRASTSRLLSYYRRLALEHTEVDFVRETDFRRDLLVLMRGWPFILFVVDDTIFVHDFSIVAASKALETHNDVLGYSLRLGRNTTECYTLNRKQELPQFAPVDADTALKFRWTDAECDFGYPLELSSSLYRGREVAPLVNELVFKNPNTLEATLSMAAERFRASHPFLLCAEQSLAFSAPLNKVQDVCENRTAADADSSVDNFAQAFARGERIDVAAFGGFTPKACHEEVKFQLTSSAAAVPLVSVVIPCFRQVEYLPEAVASVVAQTFNDWELIIVNDGSPDHTSAAANDLITMYPKKKIRLLEKKNGGLAHARNTGIATAAGAYILPLDADDALSPAFLEKTVALFEGNSDVAIAYTDISHFGAKEQTFQAAEFDFQKLCVNNQLNYCSLYRREAWEQAGGYNANMIWGFEDWDFWIACGEIGLKAQRIPEPLLRYRVKASSMLTTAMAHERELRARIALNHPALYHEGIAEAEVIWGDPHLPDAPGAPKVSVIVPTFNRPDRLEETLQSINAQTFQDFEIIVVNDNGIDVGHVAARSQAGQEIVHLRHATNRGLAAARNTALRHARGRYIAYLDDDDIFLPDHLQTLVEFLETTGNRAAYTDAWCAEETLANGRHEVVKREVRFSADWDNDRILVQNLVPVLCFMHDRRAGIAAGGFDEQMTTHEDWDFWIRLSRICAPVHIKKVTCEFRSRIDGTSMSSSRRADFLRTLRIIYKKYRKLAAGKKMVKSGQRDFMHGLKKELRKHNPSPWPSWLRNAFKS
jgi:glycosyltransferase involved in cell wall biosynthesis